MKLLTQLPFLPEDAYSLLGNSTENVKSGITIDMVDALTQNGEARTWRFKDSILGCGGILLLEDRAEAWSIISKNLAQRFKRELLVGAKRFLEEMADKYKITYMRATWQMDFDPKIRWLEHLGFVKETETVENSYIYSRSFVWE